MPVCGTLTTCARGSCAGESAQLRGDPGRRRPTESTSDLWQLQLRDRRPPASIAEARGAGAPPRIDRKWRQLTRRERRECRIDCRAALFDRRAADWQADDRADSSPHVGRTRPAADRTSPRTASTSSRCSSPSRPLHARTPRRPHPPRPPSTHQQRLLALAGRIALNHQLGRPTRSLITYHA